MKLPKFFSAMGRHRAEHTASTARPLKAKSTPMAHSHMRDLFEKPQFNQNRHGRTHFKGELALMKCIMSLLKAGKFDVNKSKLLETLEHILGNKNASERVGGGATNLTDKTGQTTWPDTKEPVAELGNENAILSTPATPADAPATLEISGMQNDFNSLWNKSFPGGFAQEQGGTIVSDASGNINIVNMTSGSAGLFTPDINVAPGQSVQGIFHTHPYDQSMGGHTGVSLSGADAACLINDRYNFVIAQSGTQQFMYMRTDATPARVDYTQLSNEQNARLSELIGHGMSFSDASKQSARETAQKYGLAYYEGANGSFHRVYPE